MRQVAVEGGFDGWRAAARQLLVERIEPSQVIWTEASRDERVLFGKVASNDATSSVGPAEIAATRRVARPQITAPIAADARRVASRLLLPIGSEPTTVDLDAASNALIQPLPRVPAPFLDLAKLVICHRDPSKYPLLYRVLWRLTHGEHDLLQNAVDDDVRALERMEKSVRRDCHKMTAFVRFKKLVDASDGVGSEQYVAWHRPDHLIVRRMAPFFVDRFRSMRWAILTPDASMEWDGHDIAFGDGVPADPLFGDAVESLWTTYYANIFNPARIKLKAMRAEMPKKHWPTLPETRLIPQMLADAPGRVRKMLDAAPTVPLMADDYVPKTSSLRVLHDAAEQCRACDIGCHATQVVFGEGPKTARLMFVGEQPGDQEDLAGRPFVGPSGVLLNEVLEQVGIDRDQVYVTNAVKHFKFEPRGKRRIHAKPNAREMAACKPWLLAELDIVKPDILVMLGATAAQTLVGRQFRITQSRGEWFETPFSRQSIATFHPSAILRSYDADTMERNKALFTDDLRKVAKALKAVA